MIHCRVLNRFHVDLQSCENIWLNVITKDSKSYIVGVLYRHPFSTDVANFIDQLNQWFLTGVRSNPKSSTKSFQGFGGRYPIFGHIINKYLLKISKLKSKRRAPLDTNLYNSYNSRPSAGCWAN